ncbi:MAG: IclR family transcriptional regulator C-terminal domain-containing protein [Tunicatimonas sp.]
MIQVIHRALNILEFIAQHPQRDFSLTEIADQHQLNHGTCANILKTLVTRGYVEQLGHKKGYRLGPMAYHLTRNKAYRRDLVVAAEAPMQHLTQAVNETSLLAIILNNRRITLHAVECDHDIQARGNVDRLVYDSATGRLLLAYQSEIEQVRFARTYGLPPDDMWPDITTEDRLVAALAHLREAGLSIVLTNRHIVGLAAPVRQQGQVVAALGVFLPETRYTDTHREEIIRELKAKAKQVSENLQ